jgi:hypothetical protein
VPVQAIGRDVEAPVGEPFDPEIRFIEAAILDRGERLDPVQAPRLAPPERFRSSTDSWYIRS